MNHRWHYMSLVRKAQSENRKKLKRLDQQYVYYEEHHILPKAKNMFPRWAKRRSNLVLLTAREHWVAHKMLDKIYPNSNMFLGLWFLANDGQNNYCVKGSREYEQLRIKAAEVMSKRFKGRPMLRNYSGCNNPMYRKNAFANKTTEEMDLIRQNMSKASKGSNNASFGKHWFTNGKDIVYDFTCPPNFWKGVPQSYKDKNKKYCKENHSQFGMKWWNNGEIHIKAHICPDGWKPGMVPRSSKNIAEVGH